MAVKVCLGGTFDPFHVGHEALLRTAASHAASLFVGVTEGELATRPDRDVAPVQERIACVKDFLRRIDYTGESTVRPLRDPVGPAASGEYDAIVVSAGTGAGAQHINAQRASKGLAPLQVITVPHVLAQDLLPISSTRVAAGDIDREGRRLRQVRVAVGSRNPVKIAAVEAELLHILQIPVEVQGFAVASGVPEQPRASQTMHGARQRARGARREWPEADYAVGIEAGLNEDPAGESWFDVQACAVVDRDGCGSEGWGPAFKYPDWITQRALQGEMISEILGPVANDPRIGGTIGAIGFLTDGRLDRTALTRSAVLMAFVPRIRRDLYDVAPQSHDWPRPGQRDPGK